MKRNNIFFKTKRKVIFLSTAIVFTCLLIFALITKAMYKSIVFNNIDSDLIRQKIVVSEIYNLNVDNNQYLIQKKNNFRIPLIPPNFIVSIYENNELVYLRENAYFSKSDLPEVKENSDNKVENISYNGYKFRAISFNDGNLKIVFMVNIDSELESVNQLMNSIILSLILLSFIALILSYFLSSKIIKPVKDAYDKQVFFVQDASHEMRTPLAVIKGKLEVLAKGKGKNNDDDLENISKMMSEIRSLEKLNSDLLLLSKEDVEENRNLEKIELKGFIEEIAEFNFDIAEIQGKTFKLKNINKDININLDRVKVKRILVILLENAFKYTNSGDKVSLIVEEINRNIKITVSDTGIGIKEEDQKRIFDRFFRSADVRGKNISGSGIGLSLLKSIAKTLGIKVKFTSTYGEGTEFQLLISTKIK